MCTKKRIQKQVSCQLKRFNKRTGNQQIPCSMRNTEPRGEAKICARDKTKKQEERNNNVQGKSLFSNQNL